MSPRFAALAAALVSALVGCAVVGRDEGEESAEAYSSGGSIDAFEADALPGPATPDDDACRFDHPPSRWARAADGVTDVGAFRVELGDLSRGGRITVRHATEPLRTLFATPAGKLLVPSQAELEIREVQGAVLIAKDVDKVSCGKANIKEIASSGGRLWMRGSFSSVLSHFWCNRLTFTVGFCQARSGHLVFDARVSDPAFSTLTIETASESHERIYGLGEQFLRDSLDLKGKKVPIVTREGGVGRDRQPISAAADLVSSYASGGETNTYYAAPHVLTSARRSFFLENTAPVVFDMRDDDAIRVRAHAPHVRTRILHGKTPLDLVQRFTEYAGRMPAIPDWANEGAIVALTAPPEQALPVVDRLRTAGVELAAVWNQRWSGRKDTTIGEQVLWNWAYNPGVYPTWQDYVTALATRNVRVLCYVNPMFTNVANERPAVARNTFAEALARNAFVRTSGGDAYEFPFTAFNVNLLDLSNRDARAWMKRLIKEELVGKARCSGWMADFGEGLPFDAKVASKTPSLTYHNVYAVEWARLQREVLEENGLLGKALVWNRSGHTKTPSVSTLLWEGDQMVTWDANDGMVSALHGLLNGGLSGIALNHSDTGGYTTVNQLGITRDRDLLERWTEMNAFTTVLRTHEGNDRAHNTQAYDQASLAHFARMSKVYKALAPYRKTLFEEARSKGYPVVRHLLLHYPDDADSWTIDDEFMLGGEILVAPVTAPCASNPCTNDKSAYLPPGRWVHLWSGATYGSTARGGRVTVKAPVGQPAVFYKAGSSVGVDLVSRLRTAGVM